MQVGVALGLAVGQLLRVQHRDRVARDRREPDLDADARFRVALAGDRVEQLGAAAQLRVVDRRARTLVGVEQLADQAGVAVEDLARVLRVSRRTATFDASSSACWRSCTSRVLTCVSVER